MNIDAKNLNKILTVDSKPYKKNHMTQSSGIYPRDARVIQHLYIDIHHLKNQQNEDAKNN